MQGRRLPRRLLPVAALVAMPTLASPPPGLLEARSPDMESVHGLESDRLQELGPPLPIARTTEAVATAMKAKSAAACDHDSFATLTGDDLVEHIITEGRKGCLDALYGGVAEDIVRAAFSDANVLHVAGVVEREAIEYSAAAEDQRLTWLFEFYAAGNWNTWAWSDEDQWSSGTRQAITDSFAAFIGNADIYDAGGEHGRVLGNAVRALDHKLHRAQGSPLIGEFALRMDVDRAMVETQRQVMYGLTLLHFNFSRHEDYEVTVRNDATLAEGLTRLATSEDLLAIDDVMVANGSRELARMLRYSHFEIFDSVKDGVRDILRIYDPYGHGVKAYIAAVEGIDWAGLCDEFDTCALRDEVIAHVLDLEYVCETSSVVIAAQSMTDAQFADACASLETTENRFHDVFETNRAPVADDHNDTLHVVVYENYDSYDTYSSWFYGNSTDNGGIYFEGEPSDPDNVARFFAYIADWLEPPVVWNLEHEFAHYLDGRYNLPGAYWDYRTDTHWTVWWLEGLAEYVTRLDDNPDAVQLAGADDPPGLADVFDTRYWDGPEMIYGWVYLAFRFMFTRHHDDVRQLLALLRAGDFDGYRNYLRDTVGSAYDDEWLEWLPQIAQGVDPARTHAVLFLPSHSAARHGFVRVVNGSDREGALEILAYDDGGAAYGPVSLPVGAWQALHFSSADLEQGNADKGLVGSIGRGNGDWRLEVTSGLIELKVLAYVRTSDGFLTGMNTRVPSLFAVHEIPVFNPGRNRSQVSTLRVVNPNDRIATVTIAGRDDDGADSGEVVATIAANGSARFTAQELESGDHADLDGGLGTGRGKWRLTLRSTERVKVLNLMESPTGHITNLSGEP